MSGDIINAVNDSSDIVYEYDAGGRLARQKDSISGEDTLYIYDNAGRLSIVQSGNREIVYKYGKNGELLSVRDNRQRLSVDFEYDKMTRETKRTFSNGVSQHTAYDSAGRQIIISEYSPTGTLTRGEAYLYGSDGKRSATVTHTGAVTKYEYNNRGQLVAVHYPDSEAVRSAQRKEAELNGMYYQENATSPKNMFLSASEHNELQSLMNRMQQTLGARLSAVQIFRSETYGYDANGNRISKTTPFGKIDYKYDAENRLLSSSSNGRIAVTYSYDANGNLLAKESLHKKSQYVYDARNRMVYSYELDKVDGVDTETRYEYDAYGRRVVTQDKGASAIRTVYDGFGFDVIRETSSYASGEISDLYDTSIKYNDSENSEKFGGARKERYHYAGKIYAEADLLAGDDAVAGGNQSAGGGHSASGNKSARGSAASAKAQARYVGEKLPLYAKGNVVGVQLGNDASYFGTDVMGSVRSVTDGYGSVKKLREYDVFGNPLETVGYNNGLEYGYAGKSYDAVTEMYNYGFRDYSPATARFTTLDPIRDGSNWFSYVANDPVNFVDLWGLMASDAKKGGVISPIAVLDNAQKAAMNNLDYKQGAGGPFKLTNVSESVTWCNQATFEIARKTDQILANAMYNEGDINGYNTNANAATRNLASAANDSKSSIVAITPFQAQNLANQGYTVVGAKEIPNGIGHVATVAPGYTFDNTAGPMMANVGGADKEGYRRAQDAYRGDNYEKGNVQFYYDSEQFPKNNKENNNEKTATTTNFNSHLGFSSIFSSSISQKIAD